MLETRVAAVTLQVNSQASAMAASEELHFCRWWVFFLRYMLVELVTHLWV